ncbi:UDP-N-acetylglucosamine transporter [Fasciola gigantica]|uniref:UDP-N-acetylglucosamine transporter n=1 Tax=Fasciola gigantica TaxID=46835 RepID=A0A504YVJ1_FASGI|nr:UDP-N-acetylglucosamine transporter [Fasciola gigantica]
MWSFLKSDVFRRRLALVSLTIQNTAVIMVTRYSRARGGDMYFASTAVVMSEVVKLITCFLLVFMEENFSFSAFRTNLKTNIVQDPWDCLLVSVPGVVYTVQNNLLFVGYSYLPAVSFQISYQLKIFTAAIFFRIILKRELSRTQWFALVLLFLGVSLTQVSDVTESSAGQQEVATTFFQQMLALASVIAACMCSGFAGVYFEKLLKGSHKSVAVRNIQLSFYGVTAGLLTVLIKDGSGVQQRGFFFGYDHVVWASVLIQSLGGLLIAATIRYADNIMKGFAPSVAIVLTFILSILFFHFTPSMMFVCGGLLVLVATVLYSICPPPKLVAGATRNVSQSQSSSVSVKEAPARA